jgi:hypothetical protein
VRLERRQPVRRLPLCVATLHGNCFSYMSSAGCCLGLLHKCDALHIQRGRVASKKAPQGEAAQPRFTRCDSSVSRLAASRWCPDSRHIVNTNEFNARSPRPSKAQRFSRPVPRQVRMTSLASLYATQVSIPPPASGHRACRSCFAGVVAAFNAHTASISK